MYIVVKPQNFVPMKLNDFTKHLYMAYSGMNRSQRRLRLSERDTQSLSIRDGTVFDPGVHMCSGRGSRPGGCSRGWWWGVGSAWWGRSHRNHHCALWEIMDIVTKIIMICDN